MNASVNIDKINNFLVKIYDNGCQIEMVNVLKFLFL